METLIDVFESIEEQRSAAGRPRLNEGQKDCINRVYSCDHPESELESKQAYYDEFNNGHKYPSHVYLYCNKCDAAYPQYWGQTNPYNTMYGVRDG